ncbi:alpha/beta hydrolase family protein [Stenotrophomonas maltophilia]|uniref:alpha/beta hydrolase family protein n=1 Tax=Stenotrophomonas maltophilia TaxID=40324 RepID=UPI0007EF32C4|nr:alpha/beta fold hydrolase [Stenotrophomonas maltophilia]OBU51509.1 hypothetical protein A9K76_02695 [Stenotrophomonas maltophilia]
MRLMHLLLGLVLIAPASLAGVPGSGLAGEHQAVTTVASAAVRDAQQRDTLRYTVWYPAMAGSSEVPLRIGPPDAPLFVVGQAAPEAAITGGRLPTLLLSHGNGGSARMMGWLGTALARAGYLVIAVDHPGNNGVDELTLQGSMLSWLRADDLRAALAAVQADPKLGPHVDAQRIGVMGFSAGGYTALLAAGARPDLRRLRDFCEAHPDDGVCQPQSEAPSHTLEARKAAAAAADLAPWMAHADDARPVPGVRAVFLMAPAIMQAFPPQQLQALRQPVSIIQGAADTVAPAATNAEVAKASITEARLDVLPGVGHYDFLSECTPLGQQRLPALCSSQTPRAQTHARTVAEAQRFFEAALKPRP